MDTVGSQVLGCDKDSIVGRRISLAGDDIVIPAAHNCGCSKGCMTSARAGCLCSSTDNREATSRSWWGRDSRWDASSGDVRDTGPIAEREFDEPPSEPVGMRHGLEFPAVSRDSIAAVEQRVGPAELGSVEAQCSK
jgi:fructose 1,6-bisphosphatase